MHRRVSCWFIFNSAILRMLCRFASAELNAPTVSLRQNSKNWAPARGLVIITPRLASDLAMEKCRLPKLSSAIFIACCLSMPAEQICWTVSFWFGFAQPTKNKRAAQAVNSDDGLSLFILFTVHFIRFL